MLLFPSTQSPVKWLEQNLKPRQPSEQLNFLKDLLFSSNDGVDQFNALVSEAWHIVTTSQLWKLEYDNIEDLKQELNFDNVVRPQLEAHQAATALKLDLRQKLENKWKEPINKALPSDMCPHLLSRETLRLLYSMNATLPRILEMCAQAIFDRQGLQGGRKHPRLLEGDVRRAMSYIADAQGPLQRASSRNGIMLSAKVPVSKVHQTQDRSNKEYKPPMIKEQSRNHQRDGLAINSTAGCNLENVADDADEVPDDKEVKMEDATLEEEKDRDEQSEEERSEEHPGLRHGCTPVCAALTSRIPSGDRPDDEEALELLEQSQALGWKSMCQNHLRRLAGALGMYTNQSNKELRKRLLLVFQQRTNLGELRDRKPRYFRRASRALGIITTRLGPYMYAPRATDAFTFNAKQVFNRFAGHPSAWDRFQHDGTININGVFDYIIRPDIIALIEEEFDMYLYHLRDELDGQRRRGWMRHMFYSLTQQLVRQDPVYYALTAAARPDQKTWLICYPYYVKYQIAGESTGFAHFDINVDEFVKTGRGKNIVQGSLSLDGETEHDCTVLVPGFHRHIHEWWARVKGRGQDSSGYTTNAKKTYLPLDQKIFGKLVPVPCKRGGIRITRPDILHGSTSKAERVRRTVFNWYSGICPDHQMLDLKESETWSQVAQCHQSMEAPMRSTSGEGFRYGRPTHPFPGVTRMSSTSRVGDALVGARRWDDIQVQQERDILLGPDDERALQLVERIRERLIQAFLEAVPYVRMNEERAYGDRSYFQNKDGPRPEAEKDGSSLSSVQLSSDDESMEDEETDSNLED